MKTRTIMLWSATLLAAVAVTLVLAALSVKEIEEPWNIVVISELLWLLRLTFIGALAHAVVFGLPLFLFLRHRISVGIKACALGGFAVGAAGPAVLGLMSMFGNSSYNAWTGGTQTIVNGVPTLAGWVEYALGVGQIGLIGVSGGLTFWLVMRLSGRIPTRPNAEQAETAISLGISRAVATSAIVSTCALLILPSVVKDNSCHNLLRDGRTSVGPQIFAYVNLTDEDWPVLNQMFVDFAQDHSLSLRSDQQIRRGQLMWRSLDLCNEAGINIKALDQPWLDGSEHVPEPIKERMKNVREKMKGIKLSIYELKAGSGWNPLAHDLLDKMGARWPEKIRFSGPGGQTISEIEALKGRQ